MTRFEHPRLDALEPSQQELYDSVVHGRRSGAGAGGLTDSQGRLVGPFGPMLLAGVVGAALGRLGETIRFDGILPDRDREIAILATAHHAESSFEIHAHTAVASQLGFTGDEILALERADSSVWTTDRERLVHQTTLEILDDGVGDDTFAALGGSLSNGELAELAILVGYYSTLAGLMETFGIAAPADRGGGGGIDDG